MTNDALQQLVATLITDFIRPSAQQHLESMQRLDRVEALLERHAEVMAGIDIKLDQIASLNQETAIAQAAGAERMSAFDDRLEETRQLVAKNASDIAQMGTQHSQMMDRLDDQIGSLVEENRAFRELQESQLAAIIGNARRLERLEQQAS